VVTLAEVVNSVLLHARVRGVVLGALIGGCMSLCGGLLGLLCGTVGRKAGEAVAGPSAKALSGEAAVFGWAVFLTLVAIT
jgi:hypothetical protein